MQRCRRTARVHQDQSGARSRDGVRDVEIKAERGDVVDDRSPGIERCACNFGFRRIDGERRFGLPRKGFNNWHNARNLFFSRYRLATRTRRFATDVDDVGAFSDHLFGVRHGSVEGEKLSAVAKAVRGDIKNAHDERALTNGHLSISNFPGDHHPQITQFYVICGWILGWSRITTGNWWQNRLKRFRSRLFQLWTILVVTGVRNRRILVEGQAGHDPSNLDSVQRLALQQAFSQPNHRLAILFDDRLCSFKLSRDDLLHLL